MRELCPRCRRPAVVCYCAALPRVETRSRVVILQHPRERDMPIGTARMATLAISGAELRTGMQWDADTLADTLHDSARPPILLAPGPDARDILREPPPGPVTLLVVDGTWSQAKSLIRRNPFLATLPRYAFTAPQPSQYRIRKEPKPEYVSTIEALMYVIGALERDPEGARGLLEPLREMVDRQLAAQATAAKRDSYRIRKLGTRQPRAPRIPTEIATSWPQIVCVVGEANAWPYTRAGERRDELVHWIAHRPSTGETFEKVVAPICDLSPTTTFHTDLSEIELYAGGTREEMLAGFAAFTRPDDIPCCWGHYPLDLLVQNGGPRFPAAVDVRGAAQQYAHRKLGSLDQFAASLVPELRAPLGLGRAGRRLANVVDIVSAWRRQVV